MLLNLYVLKNELTDLYEGIFPLVNDKVAAVELARYASQRAPLAEYRLYRIGDFDSESCKIRVLNEKKFIEFDTRRLDPHSASMPMVAMNPEDINKVSNNQV